MNRTCLIGDLPGIEESLDFYEQVKIMPLQISTRRLISRWLEIEGDFADEDITKYINDPSKSPVVKDLLLVLQKAAKLEEGVKISGVCPI